MSSSAKAIAMYGVYFSTVKEALDFSKIFYPEMKEIEDLPASAEIEILNYFSGRGIIIGYHVKIGETLEKYETKWATDFPNSEVTPKTYLEVIHF